MTPSDPSATLEEWGERFEEELSMAVAEECASLERSLSLVAALEAVLKQADDFEANRPERLVTRKYASECFRAAITREITGKGESGE